MHYAPGVSSREPELSEWGRRAERVHSASIARQAQVLSSLPQVRAILTQYQVQQAYLFGSMASGEPRPDSDVDLAVSGCPSPSFYRLAAELERALNLPLDLVDLDAAPADFGAGIKETGVLVYPTSDAGDHSK